MVDLREVNTGRHLQRVGSDAGQGYTKSVNTWRHIRTRLPPIPGNRPNRDGLDENATNRRDEVSTPPEPVVIWRIYMGTAVIEQRVVDV